MKDSALQLTCTLSLEAAEDVADGKPALPRFRMIAYSGRTMKVAGWRYPVVVDLSGLQIPSQNRPIRLGHDAAMGVGHTDLVRVEGGQLIATGVVSRDTAVAREVVASSRNGFPWQASIGAAVEESEFLKENQKAVVNGQEVIGPLNIVRKATLGEISFVDLGADGSTSASVAANAKEPEDTMEPKPETTQSDPTPAATAPTPAIAASAPQPATPPAPENASAAEPSLSPAVLAMRSEAADEAARIAAIRKLFAGQHADLEAQAIREGWDLTRCELGKMRAERPKAPVVGSAPDAGLNQDILEAACAISGKLGNLERHYDEQVLDAADKRFRGGITLQELLLEAAWANGFNGRTFREGKEILRYAFNAGVQAGFSSIDIGGILSNIGNKFLLEGFYAVERTWRNICAVRSVTDFKTVTSYRLIGKVQYDRVPHGGELKHGSLGEEKYTNKADTYGLMLSIDRRDIKNDDLDALTAVGRRLGRGAALTLNDIFWTTFLNNAAFFTAASKNLLTGVDTALGIDGLTKAEVAFMEQVDSEGKPLGAMPSILLVPPALSAIATQLNKSLELRETGANARYPVSNPHQGKFRTEVSRYLSNSKMPGSSAKAWYLLSDPNDLPVIEVAFLNGQESPTIETSEADFQTLGIQLRGYSDFGCALQEPRGGVKCRGEA